MSDIKIVFRRNKSLDTNNQNTLTTKLTTPIVSKPDLKKLLPKLEVKKSNLSSSQPIIKPQKPQVKTLKKEESVVVVKKRGRPSKEELARREREKLEKENQLKDQLIQEIKKPDLINKSENNIDIPMSPIDCPIFKVGDYVKEISMAGKRTHKGQISRQDIGSAYALVEWKDGSKQWHSAKALIKISDKEYKKKDEMSYI